jgi:hypothetical protein
MEIILILAAKYGNNIVGSMINADVEVVRGLLGFVVLYPSFLFAARLVLVKECN